MGFNSGFKGLKANDILGHKPMPISEDLPKFGRDVLPPYSGFKYLDTII